MDVDLVLCQAYYLAHQFLNIIFKMGKNWFLKILFQNMFFDVFENLKQIFSYLTKRFGGNVNRHMQQILPHTTHNKWFGQNTQNCKLRTHNVDHKSQTHKTTCHNCNAHHPR